MTQNLAVLMTTYNRVALTRRCIRSLKEAAMFAGVEVTVIVVDADSSDGTVDAVAAEIPRSVGISASSDCYWAQGMRTAWEAAQTLDYDYLLWLNDDVELLETAVSDLIAALQSTKDKAVIVGAVNDPITGDVSYSGFRQTSVWRPFNLRRVPPNGIRLEPCDTLNGNVVLVSRQTDQAIGGFPTGYVHAMADLAYGFEARKRGIPRFIAPRAVGLCATNNSTASWENASAGIKFRMKSISSPKGLPFKPWFKFCLRYGGALGIVHALYPYARLIASGMKHDLRSRCTPAGSLDV